MWRNLSNLFFLASFLLLAAAAGAYYLQPDAPGASLEDAGRQFPNLTVGENHVTYRVLNPTSHTIRVVGGSAMCGQNCCLRFDQAIPFDVPSGGAAELECTLAVQRPGQVETQFHLFFDDVGLRELVVTVRGEASAK